MPNRSLSDRNLSHRLLTGGLLACCFAAAADARVLLTVEEALALAFPDAQVERTTVFLTTAQRAEVERLAGSALDSAIVHPYRAEKAGSLVGTAYFDVHLVRTLPETLMVVVDPAGRVARVEVLSFDEPPDYRPRAEWYGQFRSRPLDDELALRRSIRPVTGASLTASATTLAVRRALALHRVLQVRP